MIPLLLASLSPSFAARADGPVVSLVASITLGVGRGVSSVTYDPHNGDVYVTNYFSDSVTVMKEADDSFVTTIRVGQGPYRAAYDPANGRIYIADYLSGDISIIDGSNNSLVGHVKTYPELEMGALTHDATQGFPTCLAVAQGSNEVFFLADQILYNESSGLYYSAPSPFLWFLDTSDNSVETYPSPFVDASGGAVPPSSIFYDPANGRVQMSAASSGWAYFAAFDPETGAFFDDVKANVTAQSLATYDPVDGFIYVSESGSAGSILAFNPATQVATALVTGLQSSGDIVYDYNDNLAYAEGMKQGSATPSIYVIDCASNSISKVIPAPAFGDLEYVPDDGRVYLNGPSTLVVDAASGNVIATVSSLPPITEGQLAYVGSDGHLFVADGASLWLLDGNSRVVRTFQYNGGLAAAAYDPSRGLLYVLDGEQGELYVVDSTTYQVERSVLLGQGASPGPYDMAYDPADDCIYVLQSGIVKVVGASNLTVLATVRVGSQPSSVAYDPSDGRIYITDSLTDCVYILDESNDQVVATIPSSPLPASLINETVSIAFSPSGGLAFMSNEGSATVSVLDTSLGVVNSTIYVDPSPGQIAYDGSANRAYVATVAGVDVIDAKEYSLVGAIPLGTPSGAIVYNPADGCLYVAEASQDAVGVIDTASDMLVATVEVGATPVRMAVDSSKDVVYVVNEGLDTVSALSSKPAGQPVPEFPGPIVSVALGSSTGLGLALSERTRHRQRNRGSALRRDGRQTAAARRGE